MGCSVITVEPNSPVNHYTMLFESVCWRNGAFQALEWHTARLQRSRVEVFGQQDRWDIRSLLESWEDPQTGCRLRQMLPPDQLIKLRFDYDATNWNITWQPYVRRSIRSLQVVEAPWLEYAHKFADRSALQALRAASTADEVLICSNGKVRDTSYCNMVFAEGGNNAKLYTPSTPLLPGTRRAALLASGRIEERMIQVSDLKEFKWVYLVNAMLPLGSVRLDAKRIVL
jgi:4-amino-4-deoxychorismate lyase